MKKHVICLGLLLVAVVAFVTPSKTVTTGRLHHVGLVWLHEPGNEAHRKRLIDAAHTFMREIPDVRGLSVGVALASESPLVDSSFDLCFVMEFDDRAVLDRYARHPVHEKAPQEAFLPLARKLLFYDFVSE
jgi:hypothetical protein